jgi:DNA-binding CsgD family transcriptional regulator
MPPAYLLAYVFTTFAVGIACLGVVVVLARRQDDLARGFLLFYAALTVLVLGALLLSLGRALPGNAPLYPSIEYLEAFVGRYGVMFTLPYFAHRVFAVDRPSRDRALLVLVLAAVAAQHVTEYGLGGFWDQAGDVGEDVLFAGVAAYTLWVGFTRLNDRRAYRPLAVRFLALLLIGLPGMGYDLFLADGGLLRLYPLWYCVVSVVITMTLFRRRFPAAGRIPAGWGLSRREEEVARLVVRGMSNREIARALTISPNTVKSHLKGIFDKSGLRSRVSVIAALTADSRNPDSVGPIV